LRTTTPDKTATSSPSAIHFDIDVACLFTSAQREPNPVTSKTEAMDIPARSMTADPSTIEDYNAGHNSNIISFCDSFRYLATQIKPDLEETSDIDTRIRAATRAFMANHA
jgi:hypothetical protein